MHPSARSARPAAVLALALAAALLAPGAATAATTEPTPATTTGPATTTSPISTTTADPTSTTSTGGTTTTSTGAPTTTAPTGTAPTTTGTASGSTTGSSSTSTSASTTTSTATSPAASTATSAAARAASTATVPFDTSNAASQARLSGSTAEQAGYAAGFMVRTLAARGDHYDYPGGTYFDGGNTVDAVLGLDGAKVGKAEADAAFAYLEQNVGGYIGTDYSSLYAGPTGKVLLAVVAHGGDPRDVGPKHVDLLAQLQSSLGAAEPGRYSDLPATGCGYDICDYSNTTGQALDIIGVGRATGSAPKEAVDYLLAQQCADGGFRGDLGAAGGSCTSDVDATAFAVQAAIGLRGTVDPAVSRALTFLAGKQAANGGFLNGDGQYNANTAGVAAQAFAAGGRNAELARAQGFLASLQLDCTFASDLRGGIAFTAADRSTLASKPGDTAALDRALRATPQATLGLAGGTLLSAGSDGATTVVPAPTCPTSATSTTSTATATTGAPTGSAAGTNAPAAPAGAPAASATPEALAFTGADVAMTALAGLLLLLVGAAALVLARRKGVHA
ncbi:prenyltransferase/squalene oxidase repeat-containing protein [Phycicoccus sp. Soil748]|uniref:prenyltransferase/squalene oxidase repeat-containing protein n=1 Tax=Phycicoccus sp. Soil748 TaxID=1736397 RepID=UPI000702EACB|nr:prenyltransferase/squalene oxidase repeat-containing protein [Phycicoccus sp. Soil748]KRE53949.1 hypothetical protein ASG70_12865 [Phycicoccus sp. Soil748]